MRGRSRASRADMGLRRSNRRGVEALPKAPSVTFDELIAIVQRRIQNPYDAAFGILQACAENIDGREHGTTGFHAWGAGAIVLACFCRPDLQGFGGELRHPDPDLVQALLLDAAGLSTDNRRGDVEARLSRFLRVFSPQSSLQGGHTEQLALSLHLLGLQHLAHHGVESTSPFDALHQAEYGATALEHLAFLYSLYVLMVSRAHVPVDKLLETAPTDSRFRLVAPQILKRRSLPVAKVNEEVSGLIAEGYRDEGVVHRFYARWPFIELTAGLYLPPPHPILRQHWTTGLVMHTLDLARIHAGRPDSPESIQMGGALEGYVGKLLHNYDAVAVEAEFEYERGTNKRSSDWIVCERMPKRSVILVQAKLKRLGPELFFGKSSAAFEGEAKTALGRAVAQSIKFLVGLESARARGRLQPGREELSARILDARELFLLGVVWSMPPILSGNPFRTVLWNEAVAMLSDAEREWLSRNDGRIAGWHILDCDELAFVSAGAGRISLWQELVRYVHAARGDLVNQRGIFPCFRDYVLERRGVVRCPPLPETWALYDGFQKLANAMAFDRAKLK